MLFRSWESSGRGLNSSSSGSNLAQVDSVVYLGTTFFSIILHPLYLIHYIIIYFIAFYSNPLFFILFSFSIFHSTLFTDWYISHHFVLISFFHWVSFFPFLFLFLLFFLIFFLLHKSLQDLQNSVRYGNDFLIFAFFSNFY